MLLIIEALLLISAALLQDHRAAVEGRVFPLDMAPNSVDDQYNGCSKNMSNLVETKYLKKELRNSELYASAWNFAKTNIKKSNNHDLSENNLIAIYVYTGNNVYREFNNDTRYGKQIYTGGTYKWYSLHFLLTNAIQILKKKQKGCFNTYRGTDVRYNLSNKRVRFGSFASSSFTQKRAKFFGNMSCFEIKTCEGAEVTEYSKLRHEREVLIPPYERFEVTQVKKGKDQDKNFRCETVYTLKSYGEKSALNCALFKKPAMKKSKNKYYIL